MNRLRIKRVVTPYNTKYIFAPLDHIERFDLKCYPVINIKFDVEQNHWTAPGTTSNLQIIINSFGEENLIWEEDESLIKRPEGKLPSEDISANSPNVKSRSQSKHSKHRAQNTRRVTKKIVDDEDQQSYEELHNISPHWRDALLRTEEQLMVRRYSFRTIKSYIAHLRLFFRYYPDITVEDIDSELIKKYIVDRVRRGNYAESTQNQILNAIKFWLEQVEGRARAYVDLRPRKKSKLPKVLSFDEVLRLFKATPNLKHRCVLKTIYSAGLRLSELCNLRVADINSDRMQVFVHGGKGKKDRYTTLSHTLLEDLREYFKEYRPEYWLFEGQTGGQYSQRSVQAILRRSVLKSGVNPFATVHTLRHSYATHLLEQGTSLRHIQELLGHQNSTTTEIYTHVSNSEKQRIISPLDRLEGLD